MDLGFGINKTDEAVTPVNHTHLHKKQEAVGPLVLGESGQFVSKAKVNFEPLHILSNVASQAFKATTRPTRTNDDITSAIEKLFKTPEYQELLRLQHIAENTPLKRTLTEPLGKLETFVNNRRRKMQPVRITKALEDIKLDLAEINEGEQRLKQLKGHVCEKCDKVFKYESHLEVHRRSHVVLKRFQCELCGKSFSLERYLVTHTSMHFSAGDHQCSICKRYFSSHHVLKKHWKTHTGEKPYTCQVCSHKFSQRANLDMHMHIHTKTKNFVCYLCNAAFSQKVHLVGHIRTHTGERPYKCNLCPKAFKKQTVLHDHKALHTSKPFRCNTCHHLYADEKSLRRHLFRYKNKKIHSSSSRNGKKFTCGICDRLFASQFSCNRHMKVHVKDLVETGV